eukprot:CAMPEP_0183327220 /NCGR_PEP_ID=MMETSP0160_2-20130417/83651_1 /TAXON_ID=2839 ORGANISM="Odontella Sinensis, Strain Grunow 1884" /NCGR_SAMPLE_ID=MMETSP0160_2 /ASSEMBLY_ACC=CAM_ASM_000250 /LENGTH=557 /DNA_ID=CAMNT_0025495345 /DNA_START=1493 /DNA_END=3166 /DNA_ORIENTATION=-
MKLTPITLAFLLFPSPVVLGSNKEEKEGGSENDGKLNRLRGYASTAVEGTRILQSKAGHSLLTEEFMAVAKEAASLSVKIYNQDEETQDELTEWSWTSRNGLDKAIVAKRNGICYGVFRGSTGEKFVSEDWQQNYKLFSKDAVNNLGDSCSVRTGYWEGYHTDYSFYFEQRLRRCASTCVEKDPCVILAGHSQGGAIAQVASVVLSDLNPLTITYGQPPSVWPECSLLNPNRMYRFVNSFIKDGSISHNELVDPVPFLGEIANGATHYGHLFVLSELESHPVWYYGTGVGSGELFQKGMDVSGEAHSSAGYENKITSLANSENFPVPYQFVDKFFGSECDYDADNCGDFGDCILGSCSAGSVGHTCLTKADCEAPIFCSTFVCQECDVLHPDSTCPSGSFCNAGSSPSCVSKYDAGEFCMTDVNCKSGKCVTGLCFDGSLGSRCDDNSDCNSDLFCSTGVCQKCDVGRPDSTCPSGSFCNAGSSPSCVSKYDTGSACLTDTNCKSGNCYLFVCRPEGYCTLESECPNHKTGVATSEGCCNNKCVNKVKNWIGWGVCP